jgi:hypothetical protein
MPDTKETQCPWCGSRQHHPDRCPQAPGVVAAPKEKAPQGSLRCDGVVGLPLVPEPPESVRQHLRRMTAREWDEEDWEDLYRLQRIINHNRAVRHGLLGQPNIAHEPRK